MMNKMDIEYLEDVIKSINNAINRVGLNVVVGYVEEIMKQLKENNNE